MYLQNLADLPMSRLSEAFNRAIRECKFFPTVAEIRAFEAEVIIPDDRIQAAYERRKSQILTAPRLTLLKSAFLDAEPQAKRPLRMLTDAEFNERVEYLKKQVRE